MIPIRARGAIISMKYTYDLNQNGCLIITAEIEDQRAIRELLKIEGATHRAECDALESLIANSDLDWIRPEEIGALTDAPILGIRRGYMEIDSPENSDNLEAPNRSTEEAHQVIAAWGYMDYQVRSFLDDLVETGKAVFIS